MQHLTLLSLCIAVSSAAFVEKPHNYAAKLGERLVMRCGTNKADDTIVWREHLNTNDPGTIIGEKDLLYHPFRQSRYNVTLIDSGLYQMTVLTLKADDAGLYSCYSTHTGKTAFAHVVVLDEDPICSGTHTTALQGDYVLYTCELKFHGKYAPLMEWTTENDMPIPNLKTNSSLISKNTVKYNAVVKASTKYNARRIRCRTYFDDVTAEEGGVVDDADYAKNRPNYTSVYVAMPLIVFSPPHDISVSPEKYHYYAGDMIECMATADPPAKYKWVEMRTGKVQEGSILTVSKDMLGRKYKCIAYNVIKDAEHHKELVIQLRTYEAPAYIWVLGLIIRLGALILILIVAPYRSIFYRLFYGDSEEERQRNSGEPNGSNTNKANVKPTANKPSNSKAGNKAKDSTEKKGKSKKCD